MNYKRKTISIIMSMCLMLLPLSASADEAAVKAQVEEIASGLVERLPMDQKIVLKALSPERSGLPENFLRKLTSDLEAALLVASEFNINLANRLSTEELWSEATEFGDADFENLYAASQADIMLMLTPRATGAGVEINITAYRLLGEDAGQVLASSGSVVLAIDMERDLGVNVINLNQQIQKLIEDDEGKVAPKVSMRYFMFPDIKANPVISEDMILAEVNGRRYVAFQSDQWDRLHIEKDIDNDGYLDAIVYSTLGGNGAAPVYYLVSYRGEGTFSVHELAESWKDPKLLEDGNSWKIRLERSSQGMGNGVLDDRFTTFSFVDNELSVDEAKAALMFSSKIFSFSEAYEAIESKGNRLASNGDVFEWRYDITGNDRVDTLQCALWVRWGYLQNCMVITQGATYSLRYKVPSEEEPQCKVISLDDVTDDNTVQLRCDYDEIVLLKVSDEESATEEGDNELPTEGLLNKFCHINSSNLTVVNISEFTNLRENAGIGNKIIDRVPLGRMVFQPSIGRYYASQRCLRVCQTEDDQAISQCIDNNEVWLQVEFDGRRGFLSRKFLE